ncbi:MAG: hemerythrin domain-containing protein [Myxococcales bacterium]|nr:hemerythrin domain-containing protein [Myxococcales bacterium]
MSCMPPHVARAEWSSHPHFPSQVLLLGSHENFRRVSREVAALAARPADTAIAEQLFLRWMSAMRSHEAYEEHKLYPFLARRACVDTRPAERGHAALHEAEREVRACFDRCRTSSRARDAGHEAARAALGAALRDHDRLLDAHLRLEEELVIPALLALSPAEFDDYYHSPIGDLLARIPARAGASCS